jgi:hypothetical protein
MSATALTNAVRTRVHSEIESDPTLELAGVVYDNLKAKKGQQAPWLRVSTLLGEAEQVTIGNPGGNIHRTPGVLSINIHDDPGIGEGRAYKIADAIRLAFLEKSADGVRYRTPTITRIGRADRWWIVNVSIPFVYDD